MQATWSSALGAACLALSAGATAGFAQGTYGAEPVPGIRHGGSRNVAVQFHIPRDARGKTADIAIEQELSRPYVYTNARMVPSGFDIISVKDPNKAYIMYSWRIENAELHKGAGSLNPIYFKTRGRYYYTNAYQFGQDGPDGTLGATVHDVTGLPDTSKVREVARIHERQFPGGFHESFGYKHSDGRALYFTQTSSPGANVYDIDKVVAGGDPAGWLAGKVPIGADSSMGRATYHDFYVQYDAANKRDVFYGAGAGGLWVYDVTDLGSIKLLTTATGVSGISRAHTFVVDPTGRYAVVETEYQYAPLRIFDLKPGLDGTVKNISRPIGAWIPQWNSLPHNVAIRWPYVFVSDYEDGFQAFNMMDPTNPYTVGYYYSCDCPHPTGAA
ncbi:MAG: hypothetical protein HY560_02905, partial [Gemmatimonadetes bacterium]|nr:hypothetical protein [Gemmatimonadota bacterium]